MNKKVIDLKGKDVRKGIPKGLPYFFVDFGMQPGFAHVIEDEQRFPNSFAQVVFYCCVMSEQLSSFVLCKSYSFVYHRKYWLVF